MNNILQRITDRTGYACSYHTKSDESLTIEKTNPKTGTVHFVHMQCIVKDLNEEQFDNFIKRVVTPAISSMEQAIEAEK